MVITIQSLKIIVLTRPKKINTPKKINDPGTSITVRYPIGQSFDNDDDDEVKGEGEGEVGVTDNNVVNRSSLLLLSLHMSPSSLPSSASSEGVEIKELSTCKKVDDLLLLVLVYLLCSIGICCNIRVGCCCGCNGCV